MILDLHQQQYETVGELFPGQEAASLKIISDKSGQWYVIKSIDKLRAFEEAVQMIRGSQKIKEIFPRIIHLDLGDIPFYTMEYIKGESLQDYIQRLNTPLEENELRAIIISSQNKLKLLHECTLEKYTSNYHNVIVNSRLENIFSCNLINLHTKNSLNLPVAYPRLKKYSLLSQGKTSPSIEKIAETATQIYMSHLPDHESIIHGDPHLGNIIYNSNNNSLRYIDPRVMWDNIQNTKTGYFDPLYDIAVINHSLITNHILTAVSPYKLDIKEKLIHITTSMDDLFQTYLKLSMDNLKCYLSREPKKGETIRYLTYIACSLSGCMRYRLWAPSAEKLMMLYTLTALFLITLTEGNYDGY